jgi:branched-chain amino acid transport system substrate-binding protein
VAAYVKKYDAQPNQFAAQAYDALYIVAATLKDIKLSGNLASDREDLKHYLPHTTINGATGPFKFRPAKTKDGKVGGWDADQKPFIYVVRGGKFTLFEGK